jgi:hypothetical protein
LVFMMLVRLKSAETNPAIKNRKQTVAWTR